MDRAITYCVLPRDLVSGLHEPLRYAFRDRPDIEVVVERRADERRVANDRRRSATSREQDRRRVLNVAGRRIGDRRAALLPVTPELPELPRKARRYVDQLVFVERVEPGTEHTEDLDTSRLVTRFQAGDSDAFATIYMRYFDRVYGYLRTVLRDAHAAEDTTQQVFTKVFEALPRYELRGRPFRAWLFVVVRNQALDLLRQQNRLESTAPEDLDERRDTGQEPDPDLSALTWVSDRELVMLIERLPLAQRQVLLLRFLLDLSTNEVARILGRSRTEVSTLQYRALRFLEQRLTALGRKPSSGGLVRMRRWGKPASVLRARRFALHGR